MEDRVRAGWSAPRPPRPCFRTSQGSAEGHTSLGQDPPAQMGQRRPGLLVFPGWCSERNVEGPTAPRAHPAISSQQGEALLDEECLVTGDGIKQQRQAMF